MWLEMEARAGIGRLGALWTFQAFVDDLVAAAASPAMVIPFLAAAMSLAVRRWPARLVAAVVFVVWAAGAWAAMELRGEARAVESAPISFAAMLVAYAWLAFPRGPRQPARWTAAGRAFASVPSVAFLTLTAYVRFSTPAAASLVGCYALTADRWQSVFSAGPPEVVVLEPGPEAPGTWLLGASDDRPMQLLGEREDGDWERSGWQPAPAGGVRLLVSYPFGGRLAFLAPSAADLRGTVTLTTDVRGNEESTRLVARRVACPPGEPDPRRRLPDTLAGE